MKRRIASGRTDGLERFMDAASTSAQRAAALTARLLAFSRRQSLDARPTDVNALVKSLEDLLSRSIRENVALRIVPGDEVPPAIIDANQLENAILNLVINARDAMPDGGQLTVETSVVDLDDAYVAVKPDVKPGRYVVVAVSDTGVGITPDVLDRIFEPFFSTKPTGQGTGLGLSMVYGFARQSEGQVRIHSRPGAGHLREDLFTRCTL
jgi:signal transduction histidine kinase